MTRARDQQRGLEEAAVGAVDGLGPDVGSSGERGVFGEAFARIGLAAAAPVPPSLRERVLSSLDASARRDAGGSDEIRPGVTLLRADGSKWRDFPFPGVRYRPLRRGDDGELRTLLIDMDPGSRYPDHPHDRVEEILVLRGTLESSGQTLREGDYCRSLPGTSDHDVFSPEGALFLVTLTDLQPASTSA